MKSIHRKYNFYSDGKSKIIVTTRFHGRVIKGVAKCSPEDVFDEEFGKQLALLRCKQKLLVCKSNCIVADLENIIKIRNNANNKILKLGSDLRDIHRQQCAIAENISNII